MTAIVQWLRLDRRDQETFRVVTAFLEKRLNTVEAIDWALARATPNNVLRTAVVHILATPTGRSLKEPWRSAWRLIEEFWAERIEGRWEDVGEYDIGARLASGERSPMLIRDLVDLVAPRLNIESHSEGSRSRPGKPSRPRAPSDFFMMSITSRRALDQSVLKLVDVDDVSFLGALGGALEAAVLKGLDLGLRLGWDGGHELWRLGQVNRVYHVPPADRGDEEHEPDEFHMGISPVVKLLYGTVNRLMELDPKAATRLAARWSSSGSPIFVRLWAALARDRRFASALDVANFLDSLSQEEFWLVNYYPEIAELRARRFSDLPSADQDRIVARIQKMPPGKVWPYMRGRSDLKQQQIRTAVQELERIKATDAALGTKAEDWLKANASHVSKLDRVDSGFPSISKAHFVHPAPDLRFDALTGETRLDAMAEALSSPRESWESDPAQRAADWLQQPLGLARILTDLESSKATRRGTAQLWERFGWAHSPQGTLADADPEVDARRVLVLLGDLPVEVLEASVEGISHWLSTWQKYVVSSEIGRAVWFRVWPLAVAATNARSLNKDRFADGIVDTVLSSGKPGPNLDSLNTASGKLVGVFLAGCPDLGQVKRPFAVGRPIRAMRDMIMTARGRSLLIAQHRMIEALGYFLRASRQWAVANLVAPLKSGERESRILWKALSRRLQGKDVLSVIGGEMIQRSVDIELDRQVRQMLATSLVLECLRASLEKRTAAVSVVEVQQMLRSVEEEVRSNVATVFSRFVNDVSTSSSNRRTPESIFSLSVGVFLKRVWPQDTSLSTAGVSKALATLPAAAGNEFVAAVESIERFLVPFDAWSLIDYGLYGEVNGMPRINLVDDSQKASALVLLLDKTIGVGDRAVVPHDLGLALAHIRKIAPQLGESSSFRRLAAVARR